MLRSPAKPAEVERDLQTLISERFGFDVPVIVRSRRQLKRVIELDPIDDAADDPKRYQVTFLADKLRRRGHEAPGADDRIRAIRRPWP